jgi:uncharacterized membrane protein (GlpM family)
MVEVSTRRNRVRTFVILGAGAVLAVAAAARGISDDVPGLLLAYPAACCLVLAVAHSWRSSKQFRRLLVASLVGFVVFTALHIPLENLADEEGAWGDDVLGALGATFFLIATMVCPAGVVVGAVGSVVTWMRERQSPPGATVPPRPD